MLSLKLTTTTPYRLKRQLDLPTKLFRNIMRTAKICVSQDISSVISLRLVFFQRIAVMLNTQPMNGVSQVLQDMKFAFLTAVLKTLKYGASTNVPQLLPYHLITSQLRVLILSQWILAALEMDAVMLKERPG